jgi:hypothetical protein
MSAEAETATNQTAPEPPDLSPEAFAAADDGDTGAPPLDPNAGQADGEPEQRVEAEGEQPTEGGEDDAPPDFWSAERKALWAKLKGPDYADVRAAIKGHVDDASKAISGKMEEAAAARKEAEARAEKFAKEQEASVAWWQQAGPAVQRALTGKWAGVDWATLARENPAEYVAKKAEHDADVAQFQALNHRQQQEAQAVQARAKEKHQQERAAEHQKLAAEFPKEFAADKAQESYNKYSKYLIAEGISPDRLEGIYEANVVKIVRKAYMYDQLQAKAKEVTNPKPNQQNAEKTPTRVVPGAAKQSANPSNEAQRQAIQALKSSGRHNLAEVADAFR